jgi:hypothetical protein
MSRHQHIVADELRDGTELSLQYDTRDERYVLVTYPGGLEVVMPFVGVDLSMHGRVQLLRRRQLGTHASGTTLEGGPEDYGDVGDVLERIAAGEHPEMVSHV